MAKTVIVEFEDADYNNLLNVASLEGIRVCDYIQDAVLMRINETGEDENEDNEEN